MTSSHGVFFSAIFRTKMNEWGVIHFGRNNVNDYYYYFQCKLIQCCKLLLNPDTFASTDPFTDCWSLGGFSRLDHNNAWINDKITDLSNKIR